ncbi:MAG TPA: LysM peptidoglycan-binding domain-containing protein [Thermoanaerobaculia bacterium]|nr:LysM peptidoglycan-binding domain-containing protein [Thermoanaerobaculia bacterium]
MAPVLLLVLAATGAYAQRQTSRPPRELHRVGDHYTAWNPPDAATYPAGARTHTIKAGDTLWALAQQYFNSPYLWPQLWESNTWIEDAHWIYPGDVLLIEGEGTAAATAGGTGTGTGDSTLSGGAASTGSDVFATDENEGGIPTARMTAESRPIPLGTESDIYCYGYIGDPNESMPNYIASHENVDVKYLPHLNTPGRATTGDLVYVAGGAASGINAGETYLIVQPAEIVKHPSTGRELGRQYNYIGQLRVLCTEDGRSRAIITESCREIPIGSRLKPLPQLPIPIARVAEPAAWCDAPTGKTNGTIVASREWFLGLVEGNLVQIDLGRDNAIQPGDFLTVTRPSPRSDQPPMILGQIGVLTTEARTATAIVLQARREILIGDRVELR